MKLNNPTLKDPNSNDKIRYHRTTYRSSIERKILPGTLKKKEKPDSLHYLKVSKFNSKKGRTKTVETESRKKILLKMKQSQKYRTYHGLKGKFRKFMYFDKIHSKGSPKMIENFKDEHLAYVVESFQNKTKSSFKKRHNSTAISKRKKNDLIEEHIAMILLNQRLALKADIKRMKEIKKSQEGNTFSRYDKLGIKGIERRSSFDEGNKLREIQRREREKRKNRFKKFPKNMENVDLKGSKLVLNRNRNSENLAEISFGKRRDDPDVVRLKKVRDRYFSKYHKETSQNKNESLTGIQNIQEGGFNFVNMPDLVKKRITSISTPPISPRIKLELKKSLNNHSKDQLDNLEVRRFSRQKVRYSHEVDMVIEPSSSSNSLKETLPLVQRVNFRSSENKPNSHRKGLTTGRKKTRIFSSGLSVKKRSKKKKKGNEQKMVDLLNSESSRESSIESQKVNEMSEYRKRIERIKQKKMLGLDKNFEKFLRKSFNGTRGAKRKIKKSRAFINQVKYNPEENTKNRKNRKLRGYSAWHHAYLAFYGLVITDTKEKINVRNSLDLRKTKKKFGSGENSTKFHDVFYPIAPDRIEGTFDYCVGKGNNGKLVKKTLALRPGTINMAIWGSAQFGWSQKYRKNAKISKTEEFRKMKIFPDHKFFQEKNLVDEDKTKAYVSEISKGVSKTLRELYRISNVNQLVSKISSLKNLNIKVKFLEKLKEYLSLENPSLNLMNYSQIRLTNHVKGLKNIGKKHLLTKHLVNFCSANQLDISSIIPKTVIVSHNEKINYDFLEDGKIYIIKPGEFSNRGKGIMMANKAAKVREMCNRILQVRKGNFVLIQEYIPSPLLFKNRKFDLRCYSLVVKLGFKMCVFWYNQGYARTSSFDYNENDLTNLKIHLTNEAVQVKGNFFYFFFIFNFQKKN